jgi:hypothetical protein
MDKDFAIIVGVLFVVIMLSLAFSTEGITGFYASSSRLIEYPFEGFEYENELIDDDTEEGLTNKPNAKDREKIRAKIRAKKLAKKRAAAAKKVEGFEGLQSGPIDEQIIGFMYNNESNTTCKGYGYTTSKGNVCLTDADIKMLTTRGMNATGVQDQIGA